MAELRSPTFMAEISLPYAMDPDEPDAVLTFWPSPGCYDPGGGYCAPVYEDIHLLIDGMDIEITEEHPFYLNFVADCESHMQEVDP